jgi:hypothetical protein
MDPDAPLAARNCRGRGTVDLIATYDRKKPR